MIVFVFGYGILMLFGICFFYKKLLCVIGEDFVKLYFFISLLFVIFLNFFCIFIGSGVDLLI